MLNEVWVLKVGGSVLTEKGEERKARKDEIRRISKEISSSGRKNLILVHGAGSYGHPQAKKYLESRKKMDALFTHQSAKELNSMVI